MNETMKSPARITDMMGRVLGLLCVLLLQHGLALAQVDVEASNEIQFNLVLPGARSLALGGAFLGRADDATAAYTNPAGLTNLHIPEFSIEARSWSFKHVFTDSGRLEGFTPTGIGVDQSEGIEDGESRNWVSGLPFLSYVYPGKGSWRRWRLAFYRHELVNFEANYRTRGAFRNLLFRKNHSDVNSRLQPTEVDADIYIASYGVSAAVGLGEALDPSLSLGMGLSFHDFSLDSVIHRYLVKGKPKECETDDCDGVGEWRGPPDYSDANLGVDVIQAGESSSISVNLGFLWRVNGVFNIGGVFRQGPKFDYIRTNIAPEDEDEPDGGEPSPKPAKFFTPDVYGLGVAVTATARTKVTFDYYRSQYSKLTNSIGGSKIPALSSFFRVDDADELHLGFEYDFPPRLKPLVALRFGAWNERDHKTRFEALCEEFDDDGDDILKSHCYWRQVQFRPGEDVIHYSGGVGLVFGIVELNLAVDLSDRTDTVAISTVFRPWQD